MRRRGAAGAFALPERVGQLALAIVRECEQHLSSIRGHLSSILGGEHREPTTAPAPPALPCSVLEVRQVIIEPASAAVDDADSACRSSQRSAGEPFGMAAGAAPLVSLREALADPQLLGSALAGDSFALWRTCLLATRGEELTPEEREAFLKVSGGKEPPMRRQRRRGSFAAGAPAKIALQPRWRPTWQGFVTTATSWLRAKPAL